MINQTIIQEFSKLVSKIKHDIEKEKTMIPNNKKNITANTFRLKQILNAFNEIKKYPEQLSLNNLDEFKQIPGIGKGTIERIKEILTTNKLKELDDFIITDKEKDSIIQDLLTIIGVGEIAALQFYNMGVKSVQDLKNKVKQNIIQVNDKIKLGLDFYGKFQGDIPRNEITSIYNIFTKIINKINKKYNTKFLFEFCGSYRREKPTSGDIDILITNSINDEYGLPIIIKELKKPSSFNNDRPLLVADITSNYETKYMGFLRYLNNFIRRVDIRIVPFESFYSALLYFTGSADLNKKMRQIAKKNGYKLSEYGLFKDDKMIPIQSEYDVFKILNIEYLHPRLR